MLKHAATTTEVPYDQLHELFVLGVLATTTTARLFPILLLVATLGCSGADSARRTSGEWATIEAPLNANFPRLEPVDLAIGADALPMRAIGTFALLRDGTMVYRTGANSPPLIVSVDTTGAVISSWGIRGEGPGELHGDEWLLADDTMVVVVGAEGGRVQRFTRNGRLVDARSNPPMGLPSPGARGHLLWWTSNSRGAGPRSDFRQGRMGELIEWCVPERCERTLLGSDHRFVRRVDSAAPPPGSGAWPAVVGDANSVWIADGYAYRIWRFDRSDPTYVAEFGREVPARMITAREMEALEANWRRMEQSGVPGPNGRLFREDFTPERHFFRERARPHFQFNALAIDGRSRLWVIGRANDSTFLDVFADTIFLGRHMVPCKRTGYAAAVSGQWVALGCEDEEREAPYELRLYRIVNDGPASN